MPVDSLNPDPKSCPLDRMTRLEEMPVDGRKVQTPPVFRVQAPEGRLAELNARLQPCSVQPALAIDEDGDTERLVQEGRH